MTIALVEASRHHLHLGSSDGVMLIILAVLIIAWFRVR